MKTALIVIALVGVVAWIFLLGGDEKEEVRKGKPEVYERIAQMTNCDELQAEFEIAVKNGNRNRLNGKVEIAEMSTGYMQAIDERMREIGCYAE